MNNIDPKKVVYAIATATVAAVAAEIILTWYRKRRDAKQAAA